MNVLVVTRSSWRNDNNIGNTMTNIFEGLKDASIHNLYFRSDLPKNDICVSSYAIQEQQLIKHLIDRRPVGNKIEQTDDNSNDSNKEQKLYDSAKKKNFMLLWFVRELVWSLGNWNNENLKKYLDEISPDIIFMPVFGCWYPHKVLKKIQKYTGARVVLFHADDNYSMKQFSFSPLFWLYRLILRKWVKRSVKISSINYCISEVQADEYEKSFDRPCKLLYKGYDFNVKPHIEKKYNSNAKLVFTGNISSGRWRTLARLGTVLDNVNDDKRTFELLIYSATPLTSKMEKSFSKCKSIKFMGAVPFSEIGNIQNNADILIHAESFRLKDKLQVRMSFSTKIVDYLTRDKCIFAVGPSDIASVDYFKKNDAAIVFDNPKDFASKMKTVIDNCQILQEYAEKAWSCGVKNHSKMLIDKMILDDFNMLCD